MYTGLHKNIASLFTPTESREIQGCPLKKHYKKERAPLKRAFKKDKQVDDSIAKVRSFFIQVVTVSKQITFHN